MPRMVTDLGLSHDEAEKLTFRPVSPFVATNVEDAILEAAFGPSIITPTAVTFAMSPYTIQPTDYLILVDTSGGAVTLQTQAASTRGGREVTIKDSTGNAAANNISILRTGAEVIDGLTTYPIASDFGAATLAPVTGGYAAT